MCCSKFRVQENYINILFSQRINVIV